MFFGAEYRDPDLAQFVIPIDLIAAAFFLLIAFAFVGLGQVLGRTFDAFPNRVLGYSINIGGSLAGIVLFSAISFLQMPPYVWIAITCAGVAYLLYLERTLSRVHLVTLVVLVVCAGMPTEISNRLETRWSPYYAVDHDKAAAFITVNNIGHQSMVNYDLAGSSYSLIHLLERHSGGKPFSHALIIGAGSGHDVTHALRFGVQSIDAVEIDPVIQDIGYRVRIEHRGLGHRRAGGIVLDAAGISASAHYRNLPLSPVGLEAFDADQVESRDLTLSIAGVVLIRR